MSRKDCINRELEAIIYDNPHLKLQEAYNLAVDAWDCHKANEEDVYATDVDYAGWAGDAE